MSVKSSVWVIDDDRAIRWVLRKALEGADIAVSEFENGQQVMAQIGADKPDAVVTDIRMPGMDGFELLRRLRERYPVMPVIITTAHADLDSAVSAFRGGAFEYLPKPFDIDDAVALVTRAIDQHQLPTTPTPAVESTPANLVGSAPAIQEVFRAIGRLSRSSINVLITGESGTGKELIARALHEHSPRAGGSFIALNVAAITRELLESELFGHEKGAFTGAHSMRIGRFEQAHEGTLFLDEIGDMPAELQTRLLRVLAEGEFYRVGGTSPIRVDVRIVAATHQAVEVLVNEGRFREDLFHRLNVVRIRVPPLRERRADIPNLLNLFLDRAATELQVDRKILSEEAIDGLTRFDWPGNVRQLENVARWLTVMTASQIVRPLDLPPELQAAEGQADLGDWQDAAKRWAAHELSAGGTSIMDKAMPALERIMIEAALDRTGGRRREAATLLGWGRNTLTRKIKDLGLAGRF